MKPSRGQRDQIYVLLIRGVRKVLNNLLLLEPQTPTLVQNTREKYKAKNLIFRHHENFLLLLKITSDQMNEFNYSTIVYLLLEKNFVSVFCV